MTDLSKIRNFSIVAHIDHGKSTLADRLLEECRAIDKREMEDQVLDNMDLERERGITIKARAVRLDYTADDGEQYVLNLIDTPGHVDFNYEVSRSLTACEGAILVVDASQGIEAQTLANTYLAIDAGLEVLPVINKIDLPAARPEEVKHEIEDVIGIPALDAPEISAKNGINIHSVLEMVVRDVPAPKGDRDAPLQCLIFDSQYDSYRGAIVYMRVMNGTVRPGMDIRFMATGAVYKVVEVGYLHPLGMSPAEELGAGEVGYLTASIKTVSDTRVGDTVTSVERPCAEALPGYQQAQPMVFSGVYPADGSKYGDLRDALEKLKLNDASMSYTQENSIALGFGFRCGFLGLLHMEIILERLEREYNLDLITTAPNVVYKITKTDGTQLDVYTPLNYPDPAEIAESMEPFAKVSVIAPPDYVGAIMDLCTNRRGEFKDMQYLDQSRVELHYSMPLNEIIYDFFDALKSRTRGYGSLDYELEGYRPSKLVKLDILLNGEIVDAQADMYFYAVQTLEEFGYHQYEISNFAKDGFICRHNMKYWTGDEYLGFGPCAASDFAGKRFTIQADLQKYLDGVKTKGVILSECDTIPLRERAGEYLMLRLRTVDGIEEGEYTKSFLLPFEPLQKVLEKLAKNDLCVQNGSRWRLTPKGFMLSNQVILTLLEAQQRSKPLAQRR